MSDIIFLTQDTPGTPGKAGIPIVVGILVGLVASFVQSLGLTIQRKSHLENDARPPARQRKAHRRPLWLIGFAIFISSNLFGTIFQIGALPIVILAPLGAVSLLWNAVLSRILLGDFFTTSTLLGTFLIALGATLIAIFGVVPEENHNLAELLQLFKRPGFVVYITLMSVAVSAVLVISHLIEMGLNRSRRRIRLLDSPTDSGTGTLDSLTNHHESFQFQSNLSRRRWSEPYTDNDTDNLISSPSPATTLYQEASNSPTRNAQLAEEGSNHSRSTSTSLLEPANSLQDDMPLLLRSSKPNSKSVLTSNPRSKTRHVTIQIPHSTVSSHDDDKSATPTCAPEVYEQWTPQEERTRIILGMSYAAASGTLSGMSLLFAKCAIELLILTFASRGQDNQFKSVQSWILLVGLGVTALLQLFYLNHSLRLASPALICPLAFCFYNISSIFDGLVFYSQFSELATVQIILVSLGIAVLLFGVWSVSAIEPATGRGGVEVGIWADESVSCDEEEELQQEQSQSDICHTQSPEVLAEDFISIHSPTDTQRADIADGHLSVTNGNIDSNSNEIGKVPPPPQLLASPRSPLSPTFDRFRPHPQSRRSSFAPTRFGTLLPEFAPSAVPSGFSIGLNPSSPGFIIRGTHPHSHAHPHPHAHSNSHMHAHGHSSDAEEQSSAQNKRIRRRSESGITANDHKQAFLTSKNIHDIPRSRTAPVVPEDNGVRERPPRTIGIFPEVDEESDMRDGDHVLAKAASRNEAHSPLSDKSELPRGWGRIWPWSKRDDA